MAIRNLIEYLPEYMREYLEIQKIMSVEQEEVDGAWNGLEAVWNNQFLQTSNEKGVSRWEHMLNITPMPTETLEERKFRIFTRWNQELPYTYSKLSETLTTLCGSEGFDLSLDAENYTINISLGVENRKNQAEVEKILQKMLPANMLTVITLLFNTYVQFENFTYGQMAAYTHEQIRNERF